MNYLLGIDFGGGASKAVLLSTDGMPVAEYTVEYPTLHPTAGACEQRPEDWIAALCEGTKALLAKSGVNPAAILAVAVDSATHTSLVCDGEGSPLRPAMHWTDTRSRLQANRLLEEYGEMIFRKTFHKPDTIWSLAQLLWLKESEPSVFSRVRRIFFEKDYIRYFLTGVYCTDYIEAQGSMLFDCNCMAWDEGLCALAGISTSLLPPVVAPTDVIGTVTARAARHTGLCEGTPVICGTTDTVMEVFASGAVEPGDVTVKLATAGRICVITDRAYPDRHLVNYSHIVPGLWYPGTATKAAASSYRWYRDTFGGEYKELDAAAAQVPIGCEGLRFHPYLNGELTPYADPMLCGSFTGVRSTHGKAHFTRAVLEGVSLSLLDSKRYLDGLQIPHKAVGTLIGGGGKGTLWRQITADVLGMQLKVTENSDSSLGSAMLAGVAAGVFTSPQAAVAACVRETAHVIPNEENTAVYHKIFEEYKRIVEALAPIYRERI
ncbi:MAG: xylulokinase [Clostridia bacterium]|nr:xylulokinase [Clostridia bacterium]